MQHRASVGTPLGAIVVTLPAGEIMPALKSGADLKCIGGQHWIDISGSDPDPNLRLPDLPAYSIVVDPRFAPNVLYVGNDSGRLYLDRRRRNVVAFPDRTPERPGG
jgi:hypothetical protein